MKTPRWIDDLFQRVDAMDPDGFASFLTEEARFRFGNGPEVVGRERIRDTVARFYSDLQALKHHVTDTWSHPDREICQGEVTYTRKDGGQVTLPFVNLFRMEKGRIKEYLVYADISPLYREGPS